MPYLGIFGLEFEKGIVIFEFNTLKLTLKVKLGAKWKSFTLGREMLYLRVLDSSFEKLLSCSKSAPLNVSNCKGYNNKKNL